MIEALVFDLDGTLVRTERLKALSYARAVRELRPEIPEAEVLEAFQAVVGRPRREAARELLERFGLKEAARARMEELDVLKPWQAFLQIRLRIYEEMLADPEVLRRARWPETIELLAWARRNFLRLALATMSDCRRTLFVLHTLELEGLFDFIASRDDVEHGKPDPEIYELVARELGVAPEECLAVEDSLPGVRAALAAGMRVVAVGTPFTRAQLAAADFGPAADRVALVDLVSAPEALPQAVRQMILQARGDDR